MLTHYGNNVRINPEDNDEPYITDTHNVHNVIIPYIAGNFREVVIFVGKLTSTKT